MSGSISHPSRAIHCPRLYPSPCMFGVQHACALPQFQLPRFRVPLSPPRRHSHLRQYQHPLHQHQSCAHALVSSTDALALLPPPDPVPEPTPAEPVHQSHSSLLPAPTHSVLTRSPGNSTISAKRPLAMQPIVAVSTWSISTTVPPHVNPYHPLQLPDVRYPSSKAPYFGAPIVSTQPSPRRQRRY